MEHTPTPWRLDHYEGRDLRNRKTFSIAIKTQDETEKIALLGGNKIVNAQFIVTACNSHDELVEALKRVLLCEEKNGVLSFGCIDQCKEALSKAGAK